MRKLYFYLLLFPNCLYVNAQVVWKGPVITFTKEASADFTNAANQDRITGNVWITRGNTQGLFNIKKEASYTGSSPNDTEWAVGSIDNYASLTYTNWFTWFGKNPSGIVDRNAVVHLKSENIYFGIKFLSWGQRAEEGGKFSYQRTTATVMPVTLQTFSGSASNNSTILHWRTAIEVNNKYFDIEHSLDGKNFLSVGRVEGNGSSTLEHAYSFTHTGLSSGKHFYRIAQQDLNGIVKYSQIILVTVNATTTLQIRPNPATLFISITASSVLKGNEFSINSYSGQVVMKGKISDQQINVQNLSSGQYWLILKTNSGELLKAQFLKK